jgi:hypothetical protein
MQPNLILTFHGRKSDISWDRSLELSHLPSAPDAFLDRILHRSSWTSNRRADRGRSPQSCAPESEQTLTRHRQSLTPAILRAFQHVSSRLFRQHFPTVSAPAKFLSCEKRPHYPLPAK